MVKTFDAGVDPTRSTRSNEINTHFPIHLYANILKGLRRSMVS